MKYTFKVTCFVDVTARDEETAIEEAEDMFPVFPHDVELWEVEEEEPDWDSVTEDKRFGIGGFRDE